MGAPTLARRLAAELLGTAFLLAGVIGSGILAARLAGGNDGLALLANAVATGCVLGVLIACLGPLSGAHFNPVVSLGEAWSGSLLPREAGLYVAAQLAGALAGTAVTHVMFALPVLQVSTHARGGVALVVSEAVATFGLVFVIRCLARLRPGAVAVGVAAWITGAYWFTASTSFANPAVTLARTLTDTFTGIRPGDAPGFLLGQLVGGAAALAFTGWLLPRATALAREEVRRAG